MRLSRRLTFHPNWQPFLVGGLNPSEKYESQLGWWHSIYIYILWKNKKCSKPPTRFTSKISEESEKRVLHYRTPNLDGWFSTVPCQNGDFRGIPSYTPQQYIPLLDKPTTTSELIKSHQNLLSQAARNMPVTPNKAENSMIKASEETQQMTKWPLKIGKVSSFWWWKMGWLS